MIIIGDKNIPFEELSYIKKVDDIMNTKANTTLVFEYNIELLRYCFDNSLSSAVVITSIKEAIYANALHSKYIICTNEKDIKIQQIAENYMFDSKVLSIIENEEEIENIALKQIDGVIYKKSLGK